MKNKRKAKIVLVAQGENPPKQSKFKKLIEDLAKGAGFANSARLIFLPNTATAKRHIRDSSIVVIPNGMNELRRELGRRDAQGKLLFTGELIFSSECNQDLCARIVGALKRINNPTPLLADV